MKHIHIAFAMILLLIVVMICSGAAWAEESECAHNHIRAESVYLYADNYTYVSDMLHSFTANLYFEQYCDLCGEHLGPYYPYGDEIMTHEETHVPDDKCTCVYCGFTNHVWNTDGICIRCEEECAHPYQSKSTYLVEAERMSMVDGKRSDLYHFDVVYEVTECADCHEILSDVAISETSEAHVWIPYANREGVKICSVCGLDCRHTYSNFINPADYWKNGKCRYCGQENIWCAHAEKDVESEERTEKDVLRYEENEHTIQVEIVREYVCSLCDRDMGSETIFEEVAYSHNLDSDGACSDCDYVYVETTSTPALTPMPTPAPTPTPEPTAVPTPIPTLTTEPVPERDYTITVSPSDKTVGADASSIWITVRASEWWSTSSNVSWISPKTTGAYGNNTVTVKISENRGSESRSGTLTFDCGDQSASVTIHQKAAENAYDDEPTTTPEPTQNIVDVLLHSMQTAEGQFDEVSIEIVGAESILNEEEYELLSRLSNDERLLVILSLISFQKEVELAMDDMGIGLSEEAVILLQSIRERIEGLTHEERAIHDEAQKLYFKFDNVEADGVVERRFSFDLKMSTENISWMERYVFHMNEEGEWDFVTSEILDEASAR